MPNRCRRVHGHPRRVRLGQDLRVAVAGGAGEGSGHGYGRGADLRDRHTAAPPGNRVPAARASSSRRRPMRRARFGPCSTRGSTRWRRTCSPKACVSPDDADALGQAVDTLLERRLAALARTTPGFAAGLRGYRRALGDGDVDSAEGLAAWLAGQPHVAAAARRSAGVRGNIDHFLALGFLQGLLTVLRDAGHPGLVLVLDEVETLQRVRSDARAKALNALRQLLDELDGGRFPGLYLVITGTPAFFDGQAGNRASPATAAAAAHRLLHRCSIRQSAGAAGTAARLRHRPARRARRARPGPLRRGR